MNLGLGIQLQPKVASAPAGPGIGVSNYFRPDGTSLYFRPDGTSIYLRP